MDNRGRVTERLQLRNLFNNPKTLYRKGAFDEYLNCFTAEPQQAFDKFFTEEVINCFRNKHLILFYCLFNLAQLTNHLFQANGTEFGIDLIALNIQRGRDHGLPHYNEYRKICGLSPMRDFTDLDKVMQHGSAQTFARLYQYYFYHSYSVKSL